MIELYILVIVVFTIGILISTLVTESEGIKNNPQITLEEFEEISKKAYQIVKNSEEFRKQLEAYIKNVNEITLNEERNIRKKLLGGL